MIHMCFVVCWHTNFVSVGWASCACACHRRLFLCVVGPDYQCYCLSFLGTPRLILCHPFPPFSILISFRLPPVDSRHARRPAARSTPATRPRAPAWRASGSRRWVWPWPAPTAAWRWSACGGSTWATGWTRRTRASSRSSAWIPRAARRPWPPVQGAQGLAPLPDTASCSF